MRAYRIMVAGQSSIFMRKFDTEPQSGDIFQMASGNWFRVNSVAHDPIGPHDPDMLLHAEAVRSFPWTEESAI